MGWLARPPGLGFYGLFALVALAVFMGSTELHAWGGTNFPNTGAELLGIVGWWAMILVVAPLYAIRLLAAAGAGTLRPAGSAHPIVRWIAAPVIVAVLGLLTVSEVIPRATGHYALGDPEENRGEAEAVLDDAAAASGVGQLAQTPSWSSSACESYPTRQMDFVEIEFDGLTEDEADTAIHRVMDHWSEVAADRGWTVYRDTLDGDHFDFSVRWVNGADGVPVLALSGRTPCTQRSDP